MFPLNKIELPKLTSGTVDNLLLAAGVAVFAYCLKLDSDAAKREVPIHVRQSIGPTVLSDFWTTTAAPCVYLEWSTNYLFPSFIVRTSSFGEYLRNPPPPPFLPYSL